MSLSSGSRSAVAINPQNPQAEALRAWWDSEGRSAALAPLTPEQRWVCWPVLITTVPVNALLQPIWAHVRPRKAAQAACFAEITNFTMSHLQASFICVVHERSQNYILRSWPGCRLLPGSTRSEPSTPRGSSC